MISFSIYIQGNEQNITFLKPDIYPLCFTEFLYGDCPPNLARPEKLTFKQVFAYLPVREELEYSLASDAAPYRAKAMCRWDRPKFAMVFASVLRSLRLLQSTKMAFGGAKFETTFKKDLRIIANASAQDFERARAVMGSEGSVIGAFHVSAGQRKHRRPHCVETSVDVYCDRSFN